MCFKVHRCFKVTGIWTLKPFRVTMGAICHSRIFDIPVMCFKVTGMLGPPVLVRVAVGVEAVAAAAAVVEGEAMVVTSTL
jgi:hypothetical protein